MNQNNRKNKENFSRLLATFYAEYFTLSVLFVFVLVTTMAYFFIFKPYYTEVTQNKMQENAGKIDRGSELRSSIASLEKYKIDFENIDQEKKEIIEYLIPEDIQEENLMPWMYKVIEGEVIDGITYGGQGLILNSISVKKIAPKVEAKAKSDNDSTSVIEAKISNSVGEVEISMTVNGVNYDKLKILLTELEKNLRLMDIQSLTVSGNSASFVIKTYYLRSIDKIPISEGNMTLYRSKMNLDIFDTEKLKELKRIDFELDDFAEIEKGNEYPFGANSPEHAQEIKDEINKVEGNDEIIEKIQEEMEGENIKVENVQI